MYRRASCKVNSAAMAAFVAGERALHEQSPAAAGGWRGGYKRLEDANKSTRSLRASFIERESTREAVEEANRHTDKEEEEHEEEEEEKGECLLHVRVELTDFAAEHADEETPVKGGNRSRQAAYGCTAQSRTLQNVI